MRASASTYCEVGIQRGAREQGGAMLSRGPRFPSGRGHRSLVVVNHLARRSRLHLLLQLVRGSLQVYIYVYMHLVPVRCAARPEVHKAPFTLIF